MAIDTYAKKASALKAFNVAQACYVVPPASIQSGDMHDVLWCYRGLADEAAVGIQWRFVSGVRRPYSA